MKTSEDIKRLRSTIAGLAQQEYDAWDKTKFDDVHGFDDEYAGGGICHFIAEKIVEVLDGAGIECQTVSSNYEQHVYCVARVRDGVFKVDVHWSVYERGGGFSWTRLPDITIDASDVSVERLDIDPDEYDKYVDESYRVPSFTSFLSEKMNETESPANVSEFWDKAPVLRLQRDIPTILDALKDRKLHPVQKDMTLKSLIPTQVVVNLKKVAKRLDKPDNVDHAIVVLRDDDDYYIIDGHHRAVSLMLRGVSRIACTVLTVADVARIL